MYDVVIQNLYNNALLYRKEAISSYKKLANLLDKDIDEENRPWFIRDANHITGRYQLQSYIKNGFIWGQKKPDENIKIFKHNEGIVQVGDNDSTKYDVIPFSKHQFLSKNIIFCTLKIKDIDTIIETNGGAIYKKVGK